MLQGLFPQFVDEVAANLLLHFFLRYRGRSPVRGPTVLSAPALFSGELDTFYSLPPEPIDIVAGRIPLERNTIRSVWDFQFDSDAPAGYPDSDRAWCRHWESHVPGRRQTIIGVDGLVQLGSRWFRRLADLLNPRGIDVVMLDAPFNFRRTPRGFRPGQLIVGGDIGHQLAVTRQAVRDLWRVARSALEQGRSVGLVGVSYGGWLTLLASLLVDNIDFLIALVPPVDIVRMLRDGGTIVRGIRRGLGHVALEPLELQRIARPIIPFHWRPRLPSDRISLHAARFDRFVPCRGIVDLAETWKTKLVVHDDAHYRLAVSQRITPVIADEILHLWPT